MYTPFNKPRDDVASQRPMAALRHIGNNDDLTYSLQPVGGDDGDSILLPQHQEHIISTDLPPCLDWDQFTRAQVEAVNYEPYLSLRGMVIPFSDESFQRIVGRIMAQILNTENFPLEP